MNWLGFVGIVVWTVLVFAAGLLVGRKHPSLADATAKVANAAKGKIG